MKTKVPIFEQMNQNAIKDKVSKFSFHNIL